MREAIKTYSLQDWCLDGSRERSNVPINNEALVVTSSISRYTDPVFRSKTHSPLIDAIGEGSSAQHHHAVASPNLRLFLLRPQSPELPDGLASVGVEA
uniref:Uncharacterized protein n=1 Tax=Oryza punctata TaxID=4537 RepID=A0A0E0JFF6_ORYPU